MGGDLALVAGLVGYAMQWMRGFKWFNDGVTLLLAVIGGTIAAILSTPETAPIKVLIEASLQNALTILGGTAVAHMAAQSQSPIMLAPRYNQFTQTQETPK